MLCIYSPFCSFKRSCIWAFKCFFILSLACVSLPKLLYWTWHLSGISAQVKIKFLVISLEVKSEKKLTKHLSDNSWICSRLNTSKFWTFLFVIWKKKIKNLWKEYIICGQCFKKIVQQSDWVFKIHSCICNWRSPVISWY